MLIVYKIFVQILHIVFFKIISHRIDGKKLTLIHLVWKAEWQWERKEHFHPVVRSWQSHSSQKPHICTELDCAQLFPNWSFWISFICSISKTFGTKIACSFQLFEACLYVLGATNLLTSLTVLKCSLQHVPKALCFCHRSLLSGCTQILPPAPQCACSYCPSDSSQPAGYTQQIFLIS